MDVSIGAFEAKNRLSELLERVARGERITITKHGRPVAMLVPPEPVKLDPDAVVEEFRSLAKGNTLSGISLRELIEEGRKL